VSVIFLRRWSLICSLLLTSLGCHAADLSQKAAWQGAAFEGDRAALEQLARSGARVLRVYREADAWVLDAAQELGLKVVMGLWVGLPHKGFRLDDPAAVARQEAHIRAFVQRYKDHPALQAWGVGNEVELGLSDPALVWREVNRLAGIVKALDPKHPTLMVATDGGVEHFRQLATCCDQVDILGLNLYAGSVFDLPRRLAEAGVAKPVLIAEMGPLGQWQAGTKPWGAPVELTSTAKAAWFREALAFVAGQPRILGAFPFLWGAKFEQTATWHGLLLPDGSETSMSDALAEAWGHPVSDPAPVIRGIGINGDVFAPGASVSVGLDAGSSVAPGQGAAEMSGWQAEWSLWPEASSGLELAAHESPQALPVAFALEGLRGVRFTAPQQPGNYRLYLVLRNGSGKAATANLPIRVEKR